MPSSENHKTLPPTKTRLHTKTTAQETLEMLHSSWGGLSSSEAEERKKHYGTNTLPQKNKRTWIILLAHQFSDPLTWILLVAAMLSLFFGESRDTFIILVIIFTNACIGFVQEYRAEQILEKLKDLTTDKAIVVRGKKKMEIDISDIVPGDILFLDAGSSIPADARIIESFSLKVNSFVFTGESQPRKRDAQPMLQASSSPAEITNLLFMGESIASGEARAVVIGTGASTELGHLAAITQEISDELTPLQKKMRILGRNVTIIALLIGITVIFFSESRGLSWYNSFLLALALSVSVVPEGLPAAISVTFTLGMKRLLNVHVLAKKLNAVETLGSVTTICTDKTGTLTKGELTVTKIILDGEEFDVSGQGYDTHGEFFHKGKVISPGSMPNAEMLFKIATLCNDASLLSHNGKKTIIGDGTEGAILVAARKYNPNPDYFRLGETKITENPFSSERMRMSVIFKNEHTYSLVKGSPDVILSLCEKKLSHGQEILLEKEGRDSIQHSYNTLSRQALRVLAFAYRKVDIASPIFSLEKAEKDLVWVGMMAMTDPPRKDVEEALKECRELGIKTVMITGDYEITAESIAKKIGLIDENHPYTIINGRTLDTLDDNKIFQDIQNTPTIFARIDPKQKLRIATLLKKNGEVIAMTGDGVNDAPALRRADIGVAMGIIGTDVSKEAADMILLDDNFFSIVKGVREGRIIFSNLKKFTHYVFTSNASELFTVTLGFVLGIPAPITAVQILSIDLGTDVLPSLALGVEPEEPGMAKRKNAPSILDWKDVRRIVSIGAIMAVGAVVAFLLCLLREGWEWKSAIDPNSFSYQKATAAAFLTLALTQMANMLQSRSTTISFFRLRFFGNPWIWGALLGSIGILWTFTSVPFFQHFLGMQTPDAFDWGIAILFTCAVFLFEEIRKQQSSRVSPNTHAPQ